MPIINIDSADADNFTAYLSLPETTPSPAVIVIQEIFGVNQVMRDLADHFAGLGYLAICPDLFWRQQPNVQLDDKSDENWRRAFALLQGFDIDLGIADLTATLTQTRSHDACSGHAGTIGYCLGGKLAYLMATRSDATCNVGYYGVDLVSFTGEAQNITHPILLHVAEEDGFVPKPDQAKVADALAATPHATIHTYPGMDHAFARLGGQHYDPTAAALANRRTQDFLSTHLNAR